MPGNSDLQYLFCTLLVHTYFSGSYFPILFPIFSDEISTSEVEIFTFPYFHPIILKLFRLQKWRTFDGIAHLCCSKAYTWQLSIFFQKKVHSFTQTKDFDLKIEMSGWPSGLRRCVQVAVHVCGRGFESHFWQIWSPIFYSLILLHIRKPVFCLSSPLTPHNYAHWTNIPL